MPKHRGKKRLDLDQRQPGYYGGIFRSRLDLFESRKELAYMQGLFLRHLFTGHLLRMRLTANRSSNGCAS